MEYKIIDVEDKIGGIINSGNNCFMIALVQALNAIKEIKDIVLCKKDAVVFTSLRKKNIQKLTIILESLNSSYQRGQTFDTIETLQTLWPKIIEETTFDENGKNVSPLTSMCCNIFYNDERKSFNPLMIMLNDCCSHHTNLNDIIGCVKQGIYTNQHPKVMMFDTTNIKRRIYVNKELRVNESLYAFRAAIFYSGSHYIAICDYNGLKKFNDNHVESVNDVFNIVDERFVMVCCFYEFLMTCDERFAKVLQAQFDKERFI